MRLVFSFTKARQHRPHFDLETVRETLLYMQSDLQSQPDLKSVAEAIADAVAELDLVANRETASSARTDVISASFVPANL